MKTEDKDMLHVLSGIDEKLIEEADPYGAGAAGTDQLNKAAYVGNSEGAGKASRGKWLRPAMGIAAAAAVLAIGIAIMKLGVPTAKPGNNERPGKTAATPTMMAETTATPTQGLPETTPTMEPAYTPTPGLPDTTATPTPSLPETTPTPPPDFPVFTPTPTMGQRPTPTPDPDAGEPLPFASWNSLVAGEHFITMSDIRKNDFYKYLSPDLIAEYRFNSATHRDTDYDRYDAVWFIKKDDDGYKNFIGVIVRKKEDTVNYEERLVSAADVEVYDVAGREDPVTVAGEEFYNATNSPIFRPEEFTDEVLARRIVYYGEDGEQHVQSWFAIDEGEDYVFHYLYYGRYENVSAKLFVSDGVLDEQTVREIDDRQYAGFHTTEDPSETEETATSAPSYTLPNLRGIYYADAVETLEEELKQAGITNVTVYYCWDPSNHDPDMNAKITGSDPVPGTVITGDGKHMTIVLFAAEAAPE